MNPVQLNVSQSLLVLSGERGVRSYVTLRRDPVTSGAGALRATVGPPMVVETTAKENTMTVTVHNHLLSKGTSIHFHGIHQHMTPWYDGVPGLSQNPIPPGNSMTYAGFAAHPVGTHYYHSHTGLESASGVHGPLIIKSPPGKDPHKKSYDRDDHVLFFSDLNVRDDTLWLAGLVSGQFTSDEDPESDLPFENTLFLLNGVELGNQKRDKNSGAVVDGFLPGIRYRLRIINAASNWALVIGLLGDGKEEISYFPMTVIASDGQNVEPRRVRKLVISPGERYDVVVSFDRAGDFPLSVETRNNHSVRGGIIRVQESREGGDAATTSASTTALGDTISLLDLSASPHALSAHASTPAMPSVADRVLDLRLGGNMRDYTWTINGNSFVHFERPLPLAIFPASASDLSRSALGDQIKENGGIVNVALGEVVDLRIVNPTMMQHPFHLHGHKFYLLGGGDAADSEAVRPVSKDSISVPPMSSLRLRVLFDNPGPWLFHCHTSYHLARGMAVAFLVGTLEEQPVPPEALVHRHSGSSLGSLDSTIPASSSDKYGGDVDAGLGFGGVFALACSLLLGIVLGAALWALVLSQKKNNYMERSHQRKKKKKKYERVVENAGLESWSSDEWDDGGGSKSSSSSSVELVPRADLKEDVEEGQNGEQGGNCTSERRIQAI